MQDDIKRYQLQRLREIAAQEMALDEARRQDGTLRIVADNTKPPPDGAAQPLGTHRATLRDPATIPPRQWLYGTILIRRFISVVIAPGGVGKTAWALTVACSLATGRALIGDWVHARVNVLVCNLEDPEEEFDRRIAAAQLHHGIDRTELDGTLYTLTGRDRRVVIAALDSDGLTVCYPDKDAMIASIRELKIGVITVDPFVNSHDLEENSNPHINAAARAWAEIASETGCAILLVHHTRKGAIAGDPDSSRGGGALVNAARAALTLTAMTPEEAAPLEIPERLRRLHIRLDDAKANLAPPGDRARWFRLASVALGNATAEYPNGDNVQAIEEWQPPNRWQGMEPDALNRVLDIIAGGPEPGEMFAPTRRGKSNERWVGQVLMDQLDVSLERAKAMLHDWFDSGLLVACKYDSPAARREASGVAVDDAKRPTQGSGDA